MLPLEFAVLHNACSIIWNSLSMISNWALPPTLSFLSFLFSFFLFSSHSSGTWPPSFLLSVSWAPYLWEVYARNIEQPCCARVIMRACTCIHSAVRLDCVSRAPEATLGKNLSLLEEHILPLCFNSASLPLPLRIIFFNPLLFASCTDTVKLLEAWRGMLSSTPPYK
jgi:hypothetical protein